MKQTKSRPLTLTATILNTVFASLTIIGAMYMLILFLGYAGYEGAGVYIGAYAIELLFAIAVLTISIVLMTKAKNTVTTFPKGLAITLFVFNIILSVFGIIGMGNSTPGMIVLQILLIAVYVLCSVFIMVDVSKNNELRRRVENGETYLDSDQAYNEYLRAQNAAPAAQPVAQPTVEEAAPAVKTAPKPRATTTARTTTSRATTTRTTAKTAPKTTTRTTAKTAPKTTTRTTKPTTKK